MSARKLWKKEINCGSADSASLKKEVFRTLSELGHSGSAGIDVLGGKPRYSAHTTIVDRRIEMKLDPDQSYVAKEKRLLEFLRHKHIAEPVVSLANALARHEATHTSALIKGRMFGCPGTLENHYELFMEEIIRVMEEKGKNPHALAAGQTAAGYMANLIQDLIDNYACQKSGSMHADMLFMYEQGMRGKYTKIYEAFSKLFAFINGNNEWNSLLFKFYGNDKQVNEAVSAIVKELGLKRGQCDMLLDEANWKRVARTMALHLAELLEYDSNGAVIILQQLPGGMHEVEPAPSDLPYQRYVEGKPLPKYMHADDAVWDIYWELAGKLEITAKGELQSMDFPCIPLTYESFDPDKHGVSDIDPFHPIFENGEFEPGVPKYMLGIDLPMKERKDGYPRVNVACLDRSGSMTDGIKGTEGSKKTMPWGDESKYHYLYLGVVSIVKGLHDKGILDQVEMGGVFFGSSSEHVSGLEAIKKTLSNPVFQGSTTLDISAIKESLGDEPSVFMTISDGHINNWASVKKKFMVLMKEHYYFHIQIGEETPMTRALRRAGFTVLSVETGEELASGMKQITLEIMDRQSKKREY